MDDVTKALFGRFPRAVGNPSQHVVHTEAEFDDFVDFCSGDKNLYSTISHYGMDGTPLTSMVSLDFDSGWKEAAFGDTDDERAKIKRMREDTELAEKVLGNTLEDTRKVCEWTIENEIPAALILTGFGFHTHLLFATEVRPKRELRSTAMMLEEELGLETLDRMPIGDVHRLMRIPNCPRVYDGRHTGHYTIPLTPEEVCDMSVSEMLELSRNPRDVSIRYDRPEMKVYEGYTHTTNTQTAHKPIEGYTKPVSDSLEQFVRSVVQLPCMKERIFQPNPSHTVRRNVAVLLFNCGMSPEEVQEIYAKINWRNYDPDVTQRQLEQIYRKRYADMSCETLQKEGLCIYDSDERKDQCETYGWSGGQCEY